MGYDRRWKENAKLLVVSYEVEKVFESPKAHHKITADLICRTTYEDEAIITNPPKCFPLSLGSIKKVVIDTSRDQRWLRMQAADRPMQKNEFILI